MRIIVYSDIHHDKFSSKCLNIEDTLNIESYIHQYARDVKASFVIFGGDRFFLRDPTDEVKTKADWGLIGNMINAPYKQYHLIGNHDWINKTMKWHTSESLRGCQNIEVLDTACSTVVNGSNAVIHSLPAGIPFDINNYEVNPNSYNIFIFHDLVVGCYLDTKGLFTSPNGLKVADIDRPEFNFVLAGDNHIPQQFAFQNTKGGYIGSTNQRTKADAGSNRGFLDINVSYNNGIWNQEINFVKVRPFFHKVKAEVNDNSNFDEVSLLLEGISDMLVEVEIVGKKENVDRVAGDSRWNNFEMLSINRGVDIKTTYEIEKSEVIVDMSSSHDIESDFSLYLDSGFVNFGNMTKDQLMAKLKSYQEVAK